MQYYQLQPASTVHMKDTENAVEWALHSQSVKLEVGPDTLPFEAIRLLFQSYKERIVHLASVMIRAE